MAGVGELGAAGTRVSRMRADGARTEARILEAAREVMETPGNSTMSAVAKRVGIGQGTLYRHFPTWESLVLAVYREGFNELVGGVSDYSDRPGLDGIRDWLVDLADRGRSTNVLTDVLLTSSVISLCDEGYQPVVDALDALLAAARERQDARSDIDGAALLVLVGFLWRTDSNLAELRACLLDVVMDGLRPADG